MERTSTEEEPLERRLLEIETERQSILDRLKELKAPKKKTEAKDIPLRGLATVLRTPVTPQEKIELFLTLFRCRESVFPKLWENPKKNIKGYSPVCRNEWVERLCGKPKVKCSNCGHQNFPPLDASAVKTHLEGINTIGTYAIRQDDTCAFLACDFDEAGWESDAFLFKEAARSFGVDVAIERSRSGAGAHAWIFFSEPVSARLARTLGTIIMNRAAKDSRTITLKSFDRFFPNQDYLPKGGFGNLIALPLQRKARDFGNSVFIDRSLKPLPDQWDYLASVRRLSFHDVKSITDSEAAPQQKPEDGDVSYATDLFILQTTDETPVSLDGERVEIILGAQLTISTLGMPSRIIHELRKTAAFPNPRFYELQRMRMATYPHPRFIFSGELREDRILLPRGVLGRVTAILQKSGALITIVDQRVRPKKIKADFSGELTIEQAKAVKAIEKEETAVLVAPPGAGKTVMACALIAKRKTPTLILVHRQPILSQWRERISSFLGISKKEIGVWGGAKGKVSGKVDIAMLQTLARKEDVEEMASGYGQIIIDECHHIPAASFEASLKRIPARYILGLTATPYRKDKLERIIYQQCGQIGYEIKNIDGGALNKRVIVTESHFRLPEEAGKHPPYHVLAHLLVNDTKRNECIVSDIAHALEKRRFPLVLTDRKDHLDIIEAAIMDTVAKEPAQAVKLFRFDGGVSARRRAALLHEALEGRRMGVAVCLLSTASLIGEGFDLPELDTLVMAMPVSFKGRVAQYAGRLHRIAEGKTDVIIHDYVDSACAMTLKMYRNRLKAYAELGYKVEEPYPLYS